MLDNAACVSEIMVCSLTHTILRQFLICRVMNSKKGKLTRLMYTQVLSNPVDIKRNCLSVHNVDIYTCHLLLPLYFTDSELNMPLLIF